MAVLPRPPLARGVSDSGHFADLLTKSLGVPVVDATFRELQVEEAYLATLRETIGENLGEFRADSVDRALSKYLGSSIRVVDGDERLDAG